MSTLDAEAREGIMYALENTDGEARDYSGRGMNGRRCLGVVTENIAALCFQLARELTYELEGNALTDALDALEDCRTDSMGTRCIIYWPKIAPKAKDGES